MLWLDVQPLDLGSDVRSVGLDLMEADENQEPVRGSDAARVWSRVLQAVTGTGTDAWVLDFFGHLNRVRDFCDRRGISYREVSQRSLVVPAPEPDALESLIERFQNETFGARAGGVLPEPDPALEADLNRRGFDAYHGTFPSYLFCAICGFEEGSLVLLSEKLRAGEVVHRVRPLLEGLDVEVRLPS